MVAVIFRITILASAIVHGMAHAGETALDEPIKPLPLNLDLDLRKVTLGRMLFQDVRLSRNDTLACSSCHALSKAGTDRKAVSVGIFGNRAGVNSPTVINSGFNFRQFWDGRADTLEDQVAEPIHDEKEMGSNWDEVIGKLKADKQYPALFNIYPGGITPKSVADAIATYERSLYSPNSRFDRYLRGETNAISLEEKRGYALFKSFGCVSCHQGMNVGGNMFQKFGVMKDFFKIRRNGEVTKPDLGRFNVTGIEADKHFFKVPSLRLVTLTPPYFHDGSAKTLRDAVDVMFEFQLGRVGSDEEKNAIIKFLHTLVGDLPEQVEAVSNVSQ